MKELCSRLMMLNPDLPYGKDYSTIALSLFLQEEGFSSGKEYSINSYAHYLYRFYSDIEKAKNNHHYKLINELWHYQPTDLFEYAKSVLRYVEDNTGLIHLNNSSFLLSDYQNVIKNENKIIQSIIQTLVIKYIGSEYKDYNTKIQKDEYYGKRVFYCDSRVFFRSFELLNYCFLSGETDVKKLCAVELKPKSVFDVNNYLIINQKYMDDYLQGNLIIKKNGYPYLHGQRLLQHIEIYALKKIRDNLDPIYQ